MTLLAVIGWWPLAKSLGGYVHGEMTVSAYYESVRRACISFPTGSVIPSYCIKISPPACRSGSIVLTQWTSGIAPNFYAQSVYHDGKSPMPLWCKGAISVYYSRIRPLSRWAWRKVFDVGEDELDDEENRSMQFCFMKCPILHWRCSSTTW